ncbi:PQ loop repeat protein [Aspergillus steynii IBT 23096]|uniref:PQ loop repeat protein n=1 Tax=Aspergillus steynii IBT 23096 TaxID=1392250 RepID=A0A2I2GLJ9_9EURO|nr:PQ loop repeat protein [Aspergillus steynii IBT 23096]PLB53745.1 PQ loop repeat protein [Aspergillus steynii IBT 23096]
MAADGNVTVASNVFGTIGTVLWCIQLIPQIWHNWTRKKTDGLPPLIMLLWACCAVPMGAYFILQQVNLPLQIQPQIFGVFSLISWGQILYYNHKFTRAKAVSLVVGLTVLFGVIEMLLVLALTAPYRQGITWPNQLVGITAAVLLAAGLLSPYLELWKRDGRVIGINWVFLSMDILGGVFSLLALASQGIFDVLGGIMYILVVVLEVGIYASHLIWRIRYRELRLEAEACGKSIDEMLDARDGMGESEHLIDGLLD